MEDAVYIFGFKTAVFILTARDAGHALTEFKNIIILSYPSITQIMVYSNCEILWAENSGSYLGCHPTENYAAGLDDTRKQSIIDQQHPRYKMLVLNSYFVFAVIYTGL